MKTKILWAEADRIHRMITRDLKEGKIKFSKKARLDVDKVPHSVIEYQDRNALLMALGAGAIIGFLCMMMVGDLMIGMIIMVAAILVPLRLAMAKKIIFPFFFAKWKSCTPFDMNKAKPAKSYTVKEKVEIQKKVRGGKLRKKWKTIKTRIREVGTLEFFEVKMQEPSDGIPIFPPENYKLMDEQASVREIIRGDQAPKTNFAMLLLMLAFGMMVMYAMYPLILQSMGQQITMIPVAAPPV